MLAPVLIDAKNTFEAFIFKKDLDCFISNVYKMYIKYITPQRLKRFMDCL